MNKNFHTFMSGQKLRYPGFFLEIQPYLQAKAKIWYMLTSSAGLVKWRASVWMQTQRSISADWTRRVL